MTADREADPVGPRHHDHRAGMADYPAAVVSQAYDNGDPFTNPIGTGPYMPESRKSASSSMLVKNANHTWWGTAVYGGPYLDRIEYIDLGTDPSPEVRPRWRRRRSTYQSHGRRIHRCLRRAGLDQVGSRDRRHARRALQPAAEEYKDVRVRKGLIDAVDNKRPSWNWATRTSAARLKTTMSARSTPILCPARSAGRRSGRRQGDDRGSGHGATTSSN